MQQESLWRYALAQQIAAHARTNPNVAAVLVEGSVAKDDADRFSDLDLAVFWTHPPSARERSDTLPHPQRLLRHSSLSHQEAGDWAEQSIRDGVTIDVRHTTLQATERLLTLSRLDAGLHARLHVTFKELDDRLRGRCANRGELRHQVFAGFVFLEHLADSTHMAFDPGQPGGQVGARVLGEIRGRRALELLRGSSLRGHAWILQCVL